MTFHEGRKKQRHGDRHNAPRSFRRGLTLSNLLFFTAGLLLALAVVGTSRLRHGGPASATVASAAAKGVGQPSAPWGNLERTPLMLERPDEFFQHDAAPPEIRWVFGGCSPGQLEAAIQSSGLSDAHAALLLDRRGWQVLSNGIAVRPPLEVVRDMAAIPRGRLYSVLARTPENLRQRFPFVFRGRLEDWFAGCKVPAERLGQLRRMLYTKGEASCFADLDFFQRTAPSNEVRELVRHLTEVPTLLLRLRVSEQSDLPSLTRYWSVPGRAEDLKLLLESVARVPGGASLSVSYFLPPVPRLLLYTYPHPEAGGSLRHLNCVWSAMNFFNAQPDDRFVEEAYTGQILNSQYRRVPKADAFGDIIMLYEAGADGAMNMVHMCVHIADDVVFTKNGGDIHQPWVLMPLADVRAQFASEAALQTAVFRRQW